MEKSFSPRKLSVFLLHFSPDFYLPSLVGLARSRDRKSCWISSLLCYRQHDIRPQVRRLIASRFSIATEKLHENENSFVRGLSALSNRLLVKLRVWCKLIDLLCDVVTNVIKHVDQLILYRILRGKLLCKKITETMRSVSRKVITQKCKNPVYWSASLFKTLLSRKKKKKILNRPDEALHENLISPS